MSSKWGFEPELGANNGLVVLVTMEMPRQCAGWATDAGTNGLWHALSVHFLHDIFGLGGSSPVVGAVGWASGQRMELTGRIEAF